MVIAILQVDDLFRHCSESFLQDEEKESKNFQCKPRRILSSGDCIKFNGFDARKHVTGTYGIIQPEKVRELKAARTQADLISILALI